ncbi:MAG TPA: MBL fold metallo-hydrolase [Armatimonadota bacterium]|nr:MBL fold metallo-hydrolase [Armatimonadota bacterium]
MTTDICEHPWKHAVTPFRIAGELYYVGNRDVSCHLIDTGEGLVLLDTGFPQTVYLLTESIRRLGFDPDDIAWILHLHAHYDHCGGTPALAELTGARTALGQADVTIIRDHPELTWTPEYGTEWHEGFDVDRPLDDGDVITIGNTDIRCIHSPGHTPGTMSYFFSVEESGRAWRVGIHGGPGVNTLTDEYMRKHNLPSSRRDDYLRTLFRLREQTVDICIGAHPGQNQTFDRQAAKTEDHNPFIDPGSWRAFLDQLDARARMQWR